MQDEMDCVPLSYAQQRLWFSYRMDRASAIYNIPLGLRLEGDLDTSAMEAGLADVIGRHESLRTTFLGRDGIPYQCILAVEEARLPLVVQDLDESALPQVMAATAATPIDLIEHIPLRAFLFRLLPKRHVFLLLIHHIVCDGWSLGPLARDIT